MFTETNLMKVKIIHVDINQSSTESEESHVEPSSKPLKRKKAQKGGLYTKKNNQTMEISNKTKAIQSDLNKIEVMSSENVEINPKHARARGPKGKFIRNTQANDTNMNTVGGASCVPQNDDRVSKGRKLRCGKKTSIVPLSFRHEDRKHLPKCSNAKSGRMRCAHCNMHTVTYCSKCEKYLCLHEWRNCYWDFHGGSATEINSETEEYDSEHASDADVSDVETGDQQPVLSDVDSGDQQTVLSDLDISEQPVENAANENNEI